MPSIRMVANRIALSSFLSFAKEIDATASSPTIIANQFINLLSMPCPIKLAIDGDAKSNNNINTQEEIINEIRAVLYTTFTSSLLFEKRKKAVSKPYVNKITKKATYA